jgi:hypothetical protein
MYLCGGEGGIGVEKIPKPTNLVRGKYFNISGKFFQKKRGEKIEKNKNR